MKPSFAIIGLRVVLVAICCVIIFPSRALAWVWWTIGDCPVAWNSDPTFQLDVSATDFYEIVKREAVSQPASRIGAVNDSWIDIDLINTTSTGSGNYESEIWMAPLPGGVLGLTMADTGPNCEILEMDVKINTDVDWVWGVPSNIADPHAANDGGDYYARPVIIHELMHAVGLDHTTADYGYMHPTVAANAVLFTNRDDEKSVEPSPKERQGLRTIYSQSETEIDLALGNNIWPDNIGSSDIINKKLCRPAYGIHWAGDFDPFCTTAQITTGLCPGDYVNLRIPVMNYGHSAAIYNLELWFSTDKTWSSLTDKKSLTVRTFIMGAVSAVLAETSFAIPATVADGTTYYVIMRIDPLNNEESTMNNWMPARGAIGISASCP